MEYHWKDYDHRGKRHYAKRTSALLLQMINSQLATREQRQINDEIESDLREFDKMYPRGETVAVKGETQENGPINREAQTNVVR